MQGLSKPYVVSISRILVQSLVEKARQTVKNNNIMLTDIDWTEIVRIRQIRMTLDEIMEKSRVPMRRGDLARFIRKSPGFFFDHETYEVTLALGYSHKKKVKPKHSYLQALLFETVSSQHYI